MHVRALHSVATRHVKPPYIQTTICTNHHSHHPDSPLNTQKSFTHTYTHIHTHTQVNISQGTSELQPHAAHLFQLACLSLRASTQTWLLDDFTSNHEFSRIVVMCIQGALPSQAAITVRDRVCVLHVCIAHTYCTYTLHIHTYCTYTLHMPYAISPFVFLPSQPLFSLHHAQSLLHFTHPSC